MAAEGARTSAGPLDHLNELRHAELQPLRHHFAAGARVLELGGGSGYQASVLHGWGCRVTSIDVETSTSAAQYYPVARYDGVAIPFPPASFDVVFSSNVLEHVVPDRLPALCGEMRRVLADPGRAIHLVPSAAWRWWSWLSRYGFLVEAARGRRAATPPPGRPGAPRARGIGHLVRRALAPPPHGEYPSAVSELYHYTRRRWSRAFRDGGFEVLDVTGAGVFYTDYALWPRLSVAWRRRAASLLGSACHVFVLRPR